MLATAEQGAQTLEKEILLVTQPEHETIALKQRNQSAKLKKLYLYASVLGIALVLGGLLTAVKADNILMVECFKALSIVAVLNLIRALSIS